MKKSNQSTGCILDYHQKKSFPYKSLKWLHFWISTIEKTRKIAQMKKWAKNWSNQLQIDFEWWGKHGSRIQIRTLGLILVRRTSSILSINICFLPLYKLSKNLNNYSVSIFSARIDETLKYPLCFWSRMFFSHSLHNHFHTVQSSFSPFFEVMANDKISFQFPLNSLLDFFSF